VFGKTQDYKKLQNAEVRAIADTYGIETVLVVALQQYLLELCKASKMPSVYVGNGFDLGVRWAKHYPGLADDWLGASTPWFAIMGGDRGTLVDSITSRTLHLLQQAGVFEGSQGEAFKKHLEDRMHGD
jgi:hypothetical protein